MKQKLKIVIDIIMMLLIFILCGYQFFEQSTHEWIGITLFILFFIHNLLNHNWYRHITKGRYSIIRILYLVIDILVLITMIIQMYSGIAMSRHVFSFLNISNNMSVVRRLHILGAYWGFIFIGLHLGMHWNKFIKAIKIKKQLSTYLPTLLFILSIIIALYGGYAFIKRDFFTYLFLQSEFVFMDFNEFSLFFYIDYLAILGLCIFIVHYGTKILVRQRGNKMSKKLIFTFLVSCCLLLTGCSFTREETDTNNFQKEVTISNQSIKEENEEKEMNKKLILTLNDKTYDIILYDTPTANALYDMLPLDLNFEDFNNIEKIAYLDDKLPTDNAPDGFKPSIGDLCLYAPWGNLSIFYKDFKYSNSLISLGHIESRIEEISNLKENFTARLEAKK